MRRCPLRFLASFVLVSTMLALAPAPASARPIVRGAVNLFSDQGDFIGGGIARRFTTANTDMVLHGDAAAFTLEVRDPDSGAALALVKLAAPTGHRLSESLYENVIEVGFQTEDRAGLSISGSGRACNEVRGWFRVKHIAIGADGHIRRLSFIFEQHCDGLVPALFGEVRIDEPDLSGTFVPSSTEIAWPETYLPLRGTDVPVLVEDTKEASRTFIRRVRVTGPGVADFRVTFDACSGATVRPARPCLVLIRFDPATAGHRVARLAFTDARGRVESVALRGVGIGGTTSFHVSGDAEDWLTQGQTYHLTPRTVWFNPIGDRSLLRFHIRQKDGGGSWSIELEPPIGETLRAGVTYLDTRRDAEGSSPGLDISGEHRGCHEIVGRFRIDRLRFDEHGDVGSVSVTFHQQCDGAGRAAGTILYRVPAAA